MKFKFYLLPLILFLSNQAIAQSCSSLTLSYTTAESRCVATGSITVNVSGGSGNYNFKAAGTITTPVTSSNQITGLPPGYYTVFVKDLNTNCTKQLDSVQVTGSYSDPRFQLVKTDATCSGNDGTISVFNQQYGRSPFTYTIIAPSPSNVGATNTTGSFTGLTPGEYAIQLQDSCGGIQVRRITIENYNWWFDSLSVIKNSCDMVDVFIKLRDNKGNTNLSGTAFNGFTYGYVLNGDTSWLFYKSFSVLIGTKRSLTIVVKDNCGNVHSTIWNLPDNVKPSLGAVNFNNLTCNTFTASVGGQNLTAPYYCLYDSAYNLITCDSSGIFPNLSYGRYCIEVTDQCYDTVITRCFTLNRNLPSINSTVSISNQSCSTFTAAITGQQNLINPQYCLYDSTNVQIACNTTGTFNNIPYGSYCIKLRDGCVDTIITRCFTVTKPVPSLTGYTLTGSTCNSFGIQMNGTNLITPKYCLYDSLGNIIICDSTGRFDSLAYANYCVRAISCGDTTNAICFTPSRPAPSVAPAVQITNNKCSGFDVSITGQSNLTTPDYCLYNQNDSLIVCNGTGIFTTIPYGSYCIKIRNSCYDTTIIRCFTQSRPLPSINTTMQLLRSDCSTVSFSVSGANLTTPDYCLYDSLNNLIRCDSTGVFNNIPYGRYCVKVRDGCIDTTMTVCQTFTPVKGITLAASKSCNIGKTNVNIQFANSNSPFVLKIYHPNGSLIRTDTTSSNPYQVQLSALPAGTQYKIVGTDFCGNQDSAKITPDANIVTKSATVRGKCPSALWQNGSGDILATINSNSYGVLPQIIKKNGAAFTQSYSSVVGNSYTFADLEPAQYIVQYTQSNCNGILYDTVTVPPYAFPAQGQSALYQCDNNGFSLGADVRGGVSPFSFQIIGSMPDSPDITGSPQSSSVFSINNGTTYSLIRLRTVDACGNATLSDVSVLPLQNISVKATDSCFYKNVTLSVDTIANATYTWYRKTTPTDSVLLASGLTYNLPFFQPEQTGQYICKVVVNNGCLTRLSSFNLTGNCYGAVLSTPFLLQGRKANNSNQLYWKNENQKAVVKYVVERKCDGGTSYSAIAEFNLRSDGSYLFNDVNFNGGINQYRLKVVYTNKVEYSNVVVLKANRNEIIVYPNPVKYFYKVSLHSEIAMDYKIELIGTNGQLITTTEVKNVISSTLTYPRDSRSTPGIYLLRITNATTGITEIRKLVFE